MHIRSQFNAKISSQSIKRGFFLWESNCYQYLARNIFLTSKIISKNRIYTLKYCFALDLLMESKYCGY